MSLKAKLEAVIYAAEEPVTLAQLAAIFADEAIAWKTEQSAQQADANAGTPAESSEIVVPEFVEPNEEATTAAGLSTEPEIDPDLEARRTERRRDREVRDILRTILDGLIAEYAADTRGIEIREIAGGFRMATKPEIHDAVRSFIKSLKQPMKLSLPALETLAVIAYKQPVTAPEVGEVRGVDSAGVLGSLLSRKLITTAGRKQVIGRPILYKTTKEFLLRFGLKDLNELPSMEEFEKMAALELSEESSDGEAEEPIEQSGDLFAEVDEKLQSSYEDDAVVTTLEASAEAQHEAVTETSIPTAETAEAHAPVERLDEIEVER